MNIFDQYGIKEVADVTLYSIHKKKDGSGDVYYVPALYLDTLKISSVEKTAENVWAQGGLGNSRLICWDYGKTINVTLEDALCTPASLGMCWGGVLSSDWKNGRVEHDMGITWNKNYVDKISRMEKAFYPRNDRETSTISYLLPQSKEDMEITKLDGIIRNSKVVDGTKVSGFGYVGNRTYKWNMAIESDMKSIAVVPEKFFDVYGNSYPISKKTSIGIKTVSSGVENGVDDFKYEVFYAIGAPRNPELSDVTYLVLEVEESLSENFSVSDITKKTYYIEVTQMNFYDGAAYDWSIKGKVYIEEDGKLVDYGTLGNIMYSEERGYGKIDDGNWDEAISFSSAKEGTSIYFKVPDATAVEFHYEPFPNIIILEDTEITLKELAAAKFLCIRVDNNNVYHAYICTETGEWVATNLVNTTQFKNIDMWNKFDSINEMIYFIITKYEDNIEYIVSADISGGGPDYGQDYEVTEGDLSSQEVYKTAGKLWSYVNPKTMTPYADDYWFHQGEPYYIKSLTLAPNKKKLKAQKITVTAGQFPGMYMLVGETYIRSRDTGEDERMQIKFPLCKVKSDQNLTLEAEGDPTTFNLDIEVARPASGIMMEITAYETASKMIEGENGTIEIKDGSTEVLSE